MKLTHEEVFFHYSAKTWSLVIGWVQVVFACVVFVIGSVTWINAEFVTYHLNSIYSNAFFPHELQNVVQIFSVVLVGVAVLTMLLAFVLVMGVNQGSWRKVTFWWIFEFHAVALLVGFVIGFAKGSVMLVAIVPVMAHFILVWEVRIYAKELKSGSGSGVRGMVCHK